MTLQIYTCNMILLKIVLLRLNVPVPCERYRVETRADR